MSEEEKNHQNEPTQIPRRNFIKGIGAAAAVLGLRQVVRSDEVRAEEAPCKVAASLAYLVVDTKKCAGCLSCMAACSLVHEGQSNYSLSRIQISQDMFGHYPNELEQSQCHQCPTPLCVQNCPTGACHAEAASGNVRMIDEEKCVGCQTCLSACPYTPHRTVWNPVKNKATKCDLCVKTPYWSEKGGPAGKQACVEVCPMKAVKLVKELPNQVDGAGYDINLRNKNAALIKLDLD